MPRPKKLDSIDKKAISTMNGVNTSTKNQLTKIRKLRIKDDQGNRPQVPLVRLYARYKGQWIDKGDTCGLCGILLSHPEVLDKHRYVCKSLDKKGDDDAYT